MLIPQEQLPPTERHKDSFPFAAQVSSIRNADTWPEDVDREVFSLAMSSELARNYPVPDPEDM